MAGRQGTSLVTVGERVLGELLLLLGVLGGVLIEKQPTRNPKTPTMLIDLL